ncbi:MAG: hypothetical protein HY544_04820 [Candidatus Diapherotrites archaeon]|uniref:Uncharacterized protein n=1 Tax=Candidatus Iainarchaeum sp. TaxID=3101447 RepID=A0A8T3YPX8_9ARCH|nr:hypothetical protein [Candidatus Diapherotrites archaeon]
MLFFDALSALFSVDIGYFVDIVLGNIFWAFAFYATIHMLVGGKDVPFHFVIFAGYAWIFLDFNSITGISLHGAFGFFLWIVLRVSLASFSKGVPFLERNFTAIWGALSYAILIFMTFFWG